MKLIVPFQKEEAFLRDVRQAPAREDVFTCWWLGQSGFLLKWQNQYLLFDPYLSDSLTKKYQNTTKPHIRMTERVISPERLDFVWVVTSSHNHTDHLDAETLLPLMAANPAVRLLIPEANRAFVAQRLQCNPDWPVGTDAGQRVEVAGFIIWGIPAAHETIEKDEAGRCHYLGYLVQFGDFAVYHSGDTLLYEGMSEWVRPFQPDLALLPINGRDPNRGVAGNLNPREAAWLGLQIQAGCVVPCHYDMFTFNTADPKDFAREAENLNVPYRILRAGEGIAIEKKKATT